MKLLFILSPTDQARMWDHPSKSHSIHLLHSSSTTLQLASCHQCAQGCFTSTPQGDSCCCRLELFHQLRSTGAAYALPVGSGQVVSCKCRCWLSSGVILPCDTAVVEDLVSKWAGRKQAGVSKGESDVFQFYWDVSQQTSSAVSAWRKTHSAKT